MGDTIAGDGNLLPRAGSGPPSKIIRPAAPLPNCSDCMARPIFYKSVLASFCIEYL